MDKIQLRQNTTCEGMPYFVATLGDKQFRIFPNSYKSEEEHPDFLGVEVTPTLEGEEDDEDWLRSLQEKAITP